MSPQARPAPSIETLDERVRDILLDQLGLEPGDVTSSSILTTDLGADSLDAIQIVMELEQEFAIEIPDDDAARLLTVQDITDYLTRKVAARK